MQERKRYKAENHEAHDAWESFGARKMNASNQKSSSEVNFLVQKTLIHFQQKHLKK